MSFISRKLIASIKSIENWILKGLFEGEENSGLGFAVSLNASGNSLVVGMPTINNPLNLNRRVRFFQNFNGYWEQTTSDIISNTTNDGFGVDLSLNAAGDVVAIGAPNQSTGRVEVWKRSTSSYGGSWSRRGGDIVGLTFNSRFGEHVSINAVGDVVACNDNNNTRVFEWNGTTWIQRGLTISGTTTYSVSINAAGDVVACNDSNGTRVFAWNGTAWIQRGITISGTTAYSVSINAAGDVVAIGLPTLMRVKIFAWNGAAWIQRGADIIGENNDQTGFSVSLNAAGDVVAIGAPYKNSFLGQVNILKWNGVAWRNKAKSINGTNTNSFGYSVSLNAAGDSVAIGAPFTNPSNSGQAAVYSKYN
jgi:hypothetical protein